MQKIVNAGANKAKNALVTELAIATKKSAVAMKNATATGIVIASNVIVKRMKSCAGVVADSHFQKKTNILHLRKGFKLTLTTIANT